MNDNLFGQKIKEARGKASQEEVAKAIEQRYGVRLSPSYLSMIENGSRKNLTTNLINALLDYFNLPAETASLLTGAKVVPIKRPDRPDEDLISIKSPDIRRIARIGDEKLTPEKQARLLRIAQEIFPEAFENDNEDN